MHLLSEAEIEYAAGVIVLPRSCGAGRGRRLRAGGPALLLLPGLPPVGCPPAVSVQYEGETTFPSLSSWSWWEHCA